MSAYVCNDCGQLTVRAICPRCGGQTDVDQYREDQADGDCEVEEDEEETQGPQV